ncbi:MAG: glycosyltransferase family 4 protein [Anaerolineae bacterium]
MRDLAFDATVFLPWAVRFRRAALEVEELVAYYERYLWRLDREREVRRTLNLESQEALVRLEGELSKIDSLRKAVDAWEARWRELERGIAWPLVRHLQDLRASLAPTGSRREEWLLRLFGKAISAHGQEIVIPPVSIPRHIQRRTSTVGMVVHVRHGIDVTRQSLETLMRHTSQPYVLMLTLSKDLDIPTRSFVQEWAEARGAIVGPSPDAEFSLDTDYIVQLDTGVLVTPHWLDYLVAFAEHDNRWQVVVPLSNQLVSLDGFEATPEKTAEQVARAAGFVPLPLDEAPSGCVLARSGVSSSPMAPVAACDAAYVHYIEAGNSSPARPSASGTVADRVWLGSEARLRVARERAAYIERGQAEFGGRRVLFVLPVATPGGGANVVISEALAMRAMGVDARIFNVPENRLGFERAYPDLQLPVLYGAPRQLSGYALDYDAIVATFNTSVEWLSPLSGTDSVCGYYIQGFEPYIYKVGTSEYERALDSYTLFPKLVRFCKTDWTRLAVLRATGADSWVVGPSVDVDVFRPRRTRELPDRKLPVRVAAMVRPASAYRSPRLTMRLLQRAWRRYRDSVEVYLFGIEGDNREFLSLPRGFDWRLAGVLEQKQMARLLADVDVFVDFSEHQAMGLTAMEAMASGDGVIAPLNGGVESFARDGQNALLVDTASERGCWEGLRRLIENRALLERLRTSALRDIVQFFPERAAFNILRVLFSPERDLAV